MPRPKLSPDFQRELERSAGLRDALKEAAETVRDHAERLEAQAHGPWMPRKGNRGQTIVVETHGDEVAVVNTDYAAHLIEWGSKNGPPHAPLRRGVRAAGLSFDED